VQRWSDAATWSGSVPAAGAAVTIPSGKTVLLDVSPPALKSLQIDGALVFDDRDLTLTADWIMVHGRLEVGTAERPFSKKATITLTGTDKSGNVMGMGTKLLGVMGGTVDLHGEARGPSWTRLSRTATAGSTQIALDRAVDWRPGDRLVVTSTDYDPNQAEEVVVSAVSGSSVTLQQPLKFTHWGVTHSIGGTLVDQCAEVGLLSRNVVVQGSADSATSRFGGHTMVHTSGTMRISGAEFTRMGQAGILGRYPIHYHLVGDGGSTSYVKNSSIHHTYSRSLTIHATNRLTVQEVVAYDSLGHSFFFEDGIETKNVLERNLGVLTRKPADGERLIPSDSMPATYWVTNPDNILRGNVAAGSATFGFWYGLPEHPTGLSKSGQNDANVWPRRTPLGEFSGNVAHSNGDTGLMVDGGNQPNSPFEPVNYDPRTNPTNAESAPSIARFQTLNAYKNRIRGVWLRGFNHEVTGAVLSDNAIGVTMASIDAVVKDSLIVGETANLGTPPSGEAKGRDGRSLPQPWEASFPIRGFEFYDGIVGVERTTFANFQPNDQRQASALSHIRKNKFPIQAKNFATELSFVNAKPVYHENPVEGFDGDKSAVFTDTTGSVTGTAGMKVVANAPFLLTKGCTYKQDWNSHLCQTAYDWLEIAARGSGAPAISNTVIRREEDGATQTLVGTAPQVSASTFVQSNVIARTAYSIKFPGATPAKLRFILRENNDNDWVRLAFPAPSTKPYVYADLSTQPLAASSSLAALDSATTDAYFVDSATNTLYVKMVVKSPWTEWATLDVCTTAGCQ
jgi:cell surface hyaluronidase